MDSAAPEVLAAVPAIAERIPHNVCHGTGSVADVFVGSLRAWRRQLGSPISEGAEPRSAEPLLPFRSGNSSPGAGMGHGGQDLKVGQQE